MSCPSANTDKNVRDLNSSKVSKFDISFSKTEESRSNKWKDGIKWFGSTLPTTSELKQYLAIIICGIFLWGTSWFLLDDVALPGGLVFNMTLLVLTGYVFGHTLERYTTISPVVGMTLIGALCRTLVPVNFLENPTADAIDFHLRRIYPVIILTKGPLAWNWEYIKRNSVKVFSLATLPWIVECLSTASFAHVLLGFPWYWGLHLGSILASVSPAIVVPTANRFSARGLGLKNQVALLVANAGGLDTTFTEGMFGVINSAIFYQSAPVYRIVKALLAIFVGIGLGVAWGVLADILPDHNDLYAPTIRSLHIISGGIFIMYAGGYFGWGGVSGVAIMVCACTAGTRWARRGWPIDNNPVAAVFKLLWRIFEPMLFTLSGYFLEVSGITARDFGLIVACIFAPLLIRMLTAFLVALVNELTVKESIFVAITWTPKAIVEAVLIRVATDSLWTEGFTAQDEWIAKQHSNIIVIAILMTSTLGSVLTTLLGPILLSRDTRISPEELSQPQALSSQRSTDIVRTNNNLDSFQYIDAQFQWILRTWNNLYKDMHDNKQTVTAIDKGVYLVHREEAKTSIQTTPTLSLDKFTKEDEIVKKKSWYITCVPTVAHYVTLVLLGLLTWGILWCAWGNNWAFEGKWFHLTIVAVIAWASGLILQELTTLPPLLAALLTGMLARHLGFIDMRHYPDIDAFLRKIYPVIILGKGSLSWDVNYMRENWRQVLALGVLPWTTEVVLVAVCTHFLLGFPWLWGFLLGSVYASVSCPVVMPSVVKHGKKASGTVNWTQLICTAGGIDTGLSVGVFGVIFTFMFYETHHSYRYIKAALGIFVGVALGIAWGTLAKFVPNSKDYFVTELRVLFVLAGGLFANFFTSSIGWGGTGAVAVLACNATAATHWAKKGWKLNQNPAATVYRVVWSTCEPVLFAYTGTFFVVHSSISKTMLIGLGILLLCLTVRLIIAALTCWRLTLKEKIFVCCTWIPKSVVEAVLCPLAIDTILMTGTRREELIYAEELMRLIVQAILVTTPLGFLLTNYLGPILLSKSQEDSESKTESTKRKSNGSLSEDSRL
ncbi:uncharacterized protein LOC123867292 [Maniola jurtina]|uniref:uncharacterized protein LOC123867292 n=1 Tax=Maniola jurtina TaxID=191418 RepID=UPI001E68619D|nr:uncharacterized protein LOC123867292 [Maniola jurtina]